MTSHKWIIIAIYILYCNTTEAFGVISSFLTGTTLAASFVASHYYCKLYECCDSNWIKNDINGLAFKLKKKLHGQEHVLKILEDSFEEYFGETSKETSKPLVLSFHGWPGTGKTYSVELIANLLFKKGLDSKYVHYFISSKDFNNHEKIQDYKKKMMNEIYINQYICGNSLYVFDEVHLMPPGLMQFIMELLTNKEYFEKKTFDYSFSERKSRKQIILLISNTGMHQINEWIDTYSFWDIDRNSIKIELVEDLIRKNYFLENDNHLYVDHFLPFLPMGEAQVVSCIKDGFENKGLKLTDEHSQMIMELLDWNQSYSGKYSKSGCKKLEHLIAFL